MRRLLCEADVVFVASASYARASWLADDWERLASRRRVQPFGVDTACFTPSAPVRTDQRKRMVFVGGMDTAHYFKGVPVLLEALAGLLQRDDWQAELVGDGDLRASYEQQAKALGLEGRVQFLGRMEDLTSFYRGAWVHVLPSTDVSEAFGLVTLEAGASGVPSMVSDLPGMRDALCPGSTGWVVPAGDHAAWTAALEQALEMSVLEREAMGSAARAWVEEHASEQAYVDAIERACAGEDSAR
jgi:glycosyltransferase involved in cell wall biosynthesis